MRESEGTGRTGETRRTTDCGKQVVLLPRFARNRFGQVDQRPESSERLFVWLLCAFSSWGKVYQTVSGSTESSSRKEKSDNTLEQFLDSVFRKEKGNRKRPDPVDSLWIIDRSHSQTFFFFFVFSTPHNFRVLGAAEMR